MGDILSYLYEYHYIQINRCHKLFEWIRKEFQPKESKKDLEEFESKTGDDRKNHFLFLKKKIHILETTNNVSSILTEFIGIRTYLDKYAAVAMERVQLHLRINDFIKDDYNTTITKKITTATNTTVKSSLEKLIDHDPKTSDYTKKWENGDLLFTSSKPNVVKINWNILDAEGIAKNNGIQQPFDKYYEDVKKANDTTGIDLNAYIVLVIFRNLMLLQIICLLLKIS